MRNRLFSEASLGLALSRKAYHFAGLCQKFLGDGSSSEPLSIGSPLIRAEIVLKELLIVEDEVSVRRASLTLSLELWALEAWSAERWQPYW